MKHHVQALREEGVPETWINDPGHLAFLDLCETERIATEAREDFIAISQRASLPDLFGSVEKVWDWTPKSTHLPPRKPSPPTAASLADDLQEQIDFHEKLLRRRAYTRENGTNCYIWEGREDEARAGLLHHSLKEAMEVAPDCLTYRSVWMWIRLPDRKNPFAFAECCAVLNQDADVLRSHLNTLRREALDHATWLKTEREFLIHEIDECQHTACSPLDWEHVGELKDALFELNDQPDIHLREADGARKRRLALDHIQCRLQEHIRSLGSDDVNDIGWLLEPTELRGMATELGEYAVIANPNERERVSALQRSVTGLLNP